MAVVQMKSHQVDQFMRLPTLPSQFLRQCGSKVDMRRLQDPLVETADFVAEMNDSDAVDFDANMGTTLADRLTNMAGKNALLQAKREQLKNAIAAFKGQVAGGQYDFDSTAPNAVVPNFYDVVRGLYTGSSTSSSSSSSSSSSTSSALFTLSEDEAAQHRNHEYVQAVREELRLAPEPNGEDEFFVVNTKGNLKHEVTCPITQCVMEQPVTCKLCKHSYDQAAVLELLKKKKGTMSCPIGGCGKMFKEGDLEKSAALERKLKKYKKEQERASQNDAGSDAEMLDV